MSQTQRVLTEDEKYSVAQRACTKLLTRKALKEGIHKAVISMCQLGACIALKHNWSLTQQEFFREPFGIMTMLEKARLVALILAGAETIPKENNHVRLYWAWEILEEIEPQLEGDALRLARLLMVAIGGYIDGVTDSALGDHFDWAGQRFYGEVYRQSRQ